MRYAVHMATDPVNIDATIKWQLFTKYPTYVDGDSFSEWGEAHTEGPAHLVMTFDGPNVWAVARLAHGPSVVEVAEAVFIEAVQRGLAIGQHGFIVTADNLWSAALDASGAPVSDAEWSHAVQARG